MGNSPRILALKASEMKSVHEVCAITHVTRKRLYYYDHIGLLKPTRRVGPQKTKMYNAKAIARLETILKLQEAGLKIQEIHRILDAAPPLQKHLLKEAAERLYRERDSLNIKIRHMEELIAYADHTEDPADQ